MQFVKKVESRRIARVARLAILFDVPAIADIHKPTCWVRGNASPNVTDRRQRNQGGGYAMPIFDSPIVAYSNIVASVT